MRGSAGFLRIAPTDMRGALFVFLLCVDVGWPTAIVAASLCASLLLTASSYSSMGFLMRIPKLQKAYGGGYLYELFPRVRYGGGEEAMQ